MSGSGKISPKAILYGVRFSKITKPVIPDDIFFRLRHEQLLLQARKVGAYTVLVSAPAGYGKTTLIAAWLSNIDASVVWLTLDKNDNDLARFLKTIVAAFVHRFPPLENRLSSLINLPLQPGIETAAELIAYEIEQYEERLYLVIDDLHTIQNPSVMVFIQHFIDIMPDNVCFILLSRSDPPLKFARLRVKNNLTEIRIDDLRLSRQEIEELLKGKTGITVSGEALSAIERRTEGWLAGILLLIITMKESSPDNLEDFFTDFFSSHKYIIEYLVEEILSQFAPDTVAFMQSSSIFDFFNAEVCNTVFSYSKSDSIIAELKACNLLIHSLDGFSEWYHYHPLLRNYLRTSVRNIGSEQYRAGVRWFEEHGFMQEALRLAVESGDEEVYFSALTQEAEKLFRHGEYRALFRWLSLLPESFYARHTDFHVYRAWSLLSQGDRARARNMAAALLEDSLITFNIHSRARLECLSVLTGGCEDDEHCMELLPEIERRAGDEDFFIRTIITILKGNSAFQHNKYPEASELYQAALKTAESISNSHLAICSVFNLSFALIQEGKWNQAKHLCIVEMKKRETENNQYQPIAEILYLPLSRVLKKQELALYEIDINLRGEEACRKFSYGLLINLKEKTEKKSGEYRPILDPLSKREIEVLRLIAKGYSNADIAETLFISLGTVKWHINNIFSKLDIKNRTQAVLTAEKHHLL